MDLCWQCFVFQWPLARQASQSMEFSRQEYWSGMPFHFPEHDPDLGIEPSSLTLQVDASPSEPLLLLLSHFSPVRLFATPWTVAYQASQSMEFSRQEYCSGLPFPSPRDLPNPGIQLVSPGLASGFFTTEPPGTPQRSSPLVF